MKTLDKGQDKIKKICEAIRNETLEPAQRQAEEIVLAAQTQAEHIIAEAHKKSEQLLADARNSIEQEQNVFQLSLQQASRQCVEALRQAVESKFFNENLYAIIEKSTASPDVVANLINAIVKSLEKEGLAANLTALIPKAVSERKVNELLLQDVLTKLKGHGIVVGNFSGGAKVTLNNKKVTIDISEEAIKELLASHLIRKDFRKLVFES